MTFLQCLRDSVSRVLIVSKDMRFICKPGLKWMWSNARYVSGHRESERISEPVQGEDEGEEEEVEEVERESPRSSL